MNRELQAAAHEQKIHKRVFEIAQTLGNNNGFFEYYFDVLPRCKSRNAAFEVVNLLYSLIFGQHRYSSYNSFRKQLFLKQSKN